MPARHFIPVWIVVFSLWWWSALAPAGNEPPLPAGDTLKVGVQLMSSHLNPLIFIRPPMLIVSAQLFASPLRTDGAGKAQPYLAKTWTVAPDGLSVTLNLVDNAKFHDGQPVTSADVAFSLLALRDHHPLKAMYQAIARVDTPDPLTAVVRLRHPHPVLEVMLSTPFSPILPKHIFGDGQPLATHPGNAAPVGSGPFRVVKAELPKYLELARFDQFFIPDRPRLQRLAFIDFGLEGDPYLWLRHGRIHLSGTLYAGNPGFPAVAADPKLVVIPGSGQLQPFSALLFNLRHKPLDDVRVRRAIALGLDRARMNEQASQGRNVLQNSPIPNNSPLYTPIEDSYPFNPERANALLDEAGYPKDERGIRFTLTLDFLPSGREMDWVGEYLRYELQRSLGIEIDLRRSATVEEWAGRMSRGDFDLDFWANISLADPLGGIHRLYHTVPPGPRPFNSNPMGYSNPAVDRLLEQAATEPNFDQRKALYAAFQRVILEDLPALPVSRFDLLTVRHRDLQGLERNHWGMFAPYDELHWRK